MTPRWHRSSGRFPLSVTASLSAGALLTVSRLEQAQCGVPIDELKLLCLGKALTDDHQRVTYADIAAATALNVVRAHRDKVARADAAAKLIERPAEEAGPSAGRPAMATAPMTVRLMDGKQVMISAPLTMPFGEIKRTLLEVGAARACRGLLPWRSFKLLHSPSCSGRGTTSQPCACSSFGRERCCPTSARLPTCSCTTARSCTLSFAWCAAFCSLCVGLGLLTRMHANRRM